MKSSMLSYKSNIEVVNNHLSIRVSALEISENIGLMVTNVTKCIVNLYAKEDIVLLSIINVCQYPTIASLSD